MSARAPTRGRGPRVEDGGAGGAYAARYRGFAGRRLALVESMLHGAFYDGIHEARGFGLRVWVLLREHGWYAADEDWAGHPLTRTDRLSYVDTHDADAVVAAISDDRGQPLVDGVTTFSDYHTEVAAEAARRLGLPGPGVRPVATANHKHLLREALGASPYNLPHVLVTGAGQLPDAARRLGFPMVAKPPSEAISHGVRLVEDAAALRRAYAELSAVRHSLRGQPRPGHVLLERYVDAPEVSVESLTIDGTTYFYGPTAKELRPPPTFLESAHSFPARLDRDQWHAVKAAVGEALDTIGYRQGPCHTEVKLTPGGPRIVEVNPRLPAGGITEMVRDVCGQSPHLDAKLLAVGERPRPPGGERRGGAAVVVLYPPQGAGVLEAVEGVEAAAAVPGVRVTLLARPGDHLWHRLDNSGRVGFVYARGPDAATALATAHRAAALVTVRVKPEEPQPEAAP
ncbi:MAG TPA: ATP-grasp domain-containing protein [Actinomycetes bacterium]|nr:ATP-grasp domain-containing protein [Actinomycetes bacterium]